MRSRCRRELSRRAPFLLTMILVLMLVGCVMVLPEDAATTPSDPTVPGNFYTSHSGHEHFGMINLDTGAGTDVGPYTHPEIDILRTDWAATSGSVYGDAFYTILNKRLPSDATPDQAEARLARIDMETGTAELVGDVMGVNLMGLEIDPCGTAYAAGFTLSNQLGEWFGDTKLYRFDLESPTLTEIGDTDIERIMDMSFDPDGTLWATVGNVLYTLDPATGAPTEVARITGVEEDNEIMGIAFTDDGTLYATTPFSDGFYTLDPVTGAVTEVGRHGFTIPHGGDIPMASLADCR